MAHFYTIGHSNLKLEQFLGRVTACNITAIADLRQQPYSGYVPHFNKEHLHQKLQHIGVAYAWLGDSLGQRFEDQCHGQNGTDLKAFFGHPLMLEGLERLERGARRFQLALLCSEGDVIACSRAMLACEALIQRGHIITHLGTKDEYWNHEQALARYADHHGISRLSLLAEADDWKALCYQSMTSG
tara:strand:+ start:6651 stop:7208 length:558 start_codon:yes stop_codon:yes gene_type:complete